MSLRGVTAKVVDNQLLTEDASPERPLKTVSRGVGRWFGKEGLYITDL